MKDEKIIEARKMLCSYLAQVAKEKGITTYDIANLTGFQRTNVSRMLNGRYSPSLDNFIKLCEASQVYIFIVDKNSEDELTELMKNRWKRIGDDQ